MICAMSSQPGTGGTSANPYAPPTAAVADPVLEAGAADEAPYFSVTPLKLVVMSIATFGLYELFWFYCQWRKIRDRDHLAIRPFWRAFFAYFFCYQCFRDIRDHAVTDGGQPARFPAGACAIGWIVLTLAGRGPDPLWLFSLGSGLMLLPAQQHANRLNAMAAPRHDRNARFTPLNLLAILCGSALLIAVILDQLR